MMNTLRNFDFNKQRKFGVEIEFFGVHYNTVTAALRRKGINIESEGYNHTTRAYWKLVYDSTVTTTGTGRERGGHELVSPPLKGQEGIDELKMVLSTLEEIGAKVDKTCGLHVHHDVNDMTLETFKNLYSLYYKFENFFDACVAPSRRDNSNYYCRAITLDVLQKIQSAKSINDMSEAFGDYSKRRYFKLNFMAYARHGTIEFRQHAGTVDKDKVAHWVKITQALIERAKLEKIRIAKGDHDKDNVSDFNHERRLRRTLFGDCKKDTLKNEYGEAFRFLQERRRHFEKAENNRQDKRNPKSRAV